MRALVIVAFAWLLSGCAEYVPEHPDRRYDALDRLMENALDGYARGDLLKTHRMGLVLDQLVAGVDKSAVVTVPGLRAAMAHQLAERCERAMRLDEDGAQSDECYASHKARRFFDEVDLVVRDIGWRIDETYSIAEYESRARRALALYEWAISE